MLTHPSYTEQGEGEKEEKEEKNLLLKIKKEKSEIKLGAVWDTVEEILTSHSRHPELDSNTT